MTGANLRSCGIDWDLRKKMPYSGYDRFDFDIPTETAGCSFARYLVRLGEMRQSLRIVKQAAADMPDGRYVTNDCRYAYPERNAGKKDIETQIHHFMNVSRGLTPPVGESYSGIESSKCEFGYYVVSDGGNTPYRLRIRTPSFAHMQAFPKMTKGWMIADLIMVLGAIDFILADLDR